MKRNTGHADDLGSVGEEAGVKFSFSVSIPVTASPRKKGKKPSTIVGGADYDGSGRGSSSKEEAKAARSVELKSPSWWLRKVDTSGLGCSIKPEFGE